MSIFDAGKVCTFSSISGVILKDGKPVPNAVVTRTTSYQSEKKDKTQTNEEGYFEMPALFERSVLSMLPQEFAVGQRLVVTIGNEEHDIWSGVKRIKDENSEAKGQPLIVTCDLGDEKQAFEVDRQPFITKCKWDVIPDNVDTGF